MRSQKILTKKIIEKILAIGQVDDDPAKSVTEDFIDKDLQQKELTETSSLPELLSSEELEEFITLDDSGFMAEGSIDDTVPLTGKDYLQKAICDFTHIESSAMKLLHESSINLWGSPLLYDFLFEPLQCFNISKMKLEWNGAGDDGYYEIFITFGNGTQIKSDGYYDPWKYPLDEVLRYLLNLPPGAEIDTGSVGSITVDVQNGEVDRFYKDNYHEELLEFLTAFRYNGVQKAYSELSLDRVQEIRGSKNKPLDSKRISELFAEDVTWRLSQLKIYKGDQWFDDKSWQYQHLQINKIFTFFEDFNAIDDLEQLVKKLFGKNLHKLSAKDFSEPLKLFFLAEEGKIEFSFLDESYEIDLVSHNENNSLSLDENNFERLKALREISNPSCNFIREIMPEVDASGKSPSEWMLDRYTSLIEKKYSEYGYYSSILTEETALELLNSSELDEWKQFEQIDLAAAKILLTHAGDLHLSNLKCLSESVATVLSQHDGGIVLDGLTELSDSVAESLSEHKGALSLCGLTDLSDLAAEYLAMHNGDLWLDGLTELSDVAARAFSKHKGFLFMRWVYNLSDLAAKSLSLKYYPNSVVLSVKSDMKVISFRKITVQIAERILNDEDFEYDEFQFKSIDDQAAELLAGSDEGELFLDGLSSISNKTAEYLSKFRGDLWLYGLTELSDAAAESLSKHKGDLSLSGITELSDAAAKSLSKHKGELSLNRVESLSQKAREYLTKQNIVLP